MSNIHKLSGAAQSMSEDQAARAIINEDLRRNVGNRSFPQPRTLRIKLNKAAPTVVGVSKKP